MDVDQVKLVRGSFCIGEVLCLHRKLCSMCSLRYFTHTLHLFESENNKKKKLKKKRIYLHVYLHVLKEFGTIPDFIPVIQSRLHDDGDDDKATDAHDQDLIMMKELLLLIMVTMMQL